MRNILFYVLTVLGGYLLGCSSMAYYVSRWKKVNLSTNGSGNLGASNTTILLGWRMGILVALHDIFKGAAAVLLAKWLLPDLTYAPVAAGCACVMGHMYPFYLKGKGGKGFASYMGMLLALDWRLGLALIGVSPAGDVLVGLHRGRDPDHGGSGACLDRLHTKLGIGGHHAGRHRRDFLQAPGESPPHSPRRRGGSAQHAEGRASAAEELNFRPASGYFRIRGGFFPGNLCFPLVISEKMAYTRLL